MKLLKITTAIILCLCSLGGVMYYQMQPHDLEVYFFDVGQGDAILIRTPENQDILIDAGPDDKIVYHLGNTLPFWDRDLELVILTHPHEDHVAGMPDVLKKYEVDKVLYMDVEYENTNFDEMKRLIEEKGIEANETYWGDEFYFDSNIKLETLFPFINSDLNGFEDLNDTSIVNKLVYGENEFLFTGDAGQDIEEQILGNGIEVEADILKVGHHGSKYSSSQEFLDAIGPEAAIYQVGLGNSFKHPHFITIWNLDNMGVDQYRTDEQGTIKVESNGENVIISTSK
ncbi:MBL fold metallo-hydrolase [Patescibacteria group bacterium]|nr:MBL fold metallo-hydrolase [Patescibacteria group bacterium]